MRKTLPGFCGLGAAATSELSMSLYPSFMAASNLDVNNAFTSMLSRRASFAKALEPGARSKFVEDSCAIDFDLFYELKSLLEASGESKNVVEEVLLLRPVTHGAQSSPSSSTSETVQNRAHCMYCIEHFSKRM